MSKTDFKEPQQVENMRAKEASRYLACGVSTLWLWVKQGKIKAYKLSDRVTIFKRSELDTFINAGGAV
jgi:excisionase family DNA binding protein